LYLDYNEFVSQHDLKDTGVQDNMLTQDSTGATSTSSGNSWTALWTPWFAC
jgi:hypothetical protein